MIFIDSGAFLGRFIERDQYHNRAVDHWKALEADGRRCFTSNFVLDETITLLARRTTYDFAADRARSLYASGELSILRPDESDEQSALTLFQRYADQSVSFTDCVSFVLMQRHGITTAFSFDRHFTLSGFRVEPV